jgi:hypothetical protein
MSAGADQPREGSSNCVHCDHTVQCSEIGDYGIAAAWHAIEFFDGQLSRIHPAAARDPDHFRRGVDGSYPRARAHKVQRIFSGAAAKVKNVVARVKERIDPPPHGISLNTADRRAGPQLVIARRDCVKAPHL